MNGLLGLKTKQAPLFNRRISPGLLVKEESAYEQKVSNLESLGKFFLDEKDGEGLTLLGRLLRIKALMNDTSFRFLGSMKHGILREYHVPRRGCGCVFNLVEQVRTVQLDLYASSSSHTSDQQPRHQLKAHFFHTYSLTTIIMDSGDRPRVPPLRWSYVCCPSS